jgi:hypothetical protein
VFCVLRTDLKARLRRLHLRTFHQLRNHFRQTDCSLLTRGS